MNGRELHSEINQAAVSVRLQHLQRLRDCGVSYSALASLNAVQPTIGVSRVRLASEGLFEPCEEGEAVVVQAAVEESGEPGDAGVIDLLAWRTVDPSRWWWRIGNASALGGELLRGDHPVPVVETPCAWLAAGGNALCVLDWSLRSPVWSLLRSGPPLVFSDDALRQRVRNALVLTAPIPRMDLTHAS